MFPSLYWCMNSTEADHFLFDKQCITKNWLCLNRSHYISNVSFSNVEKNACLSSQTSSICLQMQDNRQYLSLPFICLLWGASHLLKKVTVASAIEAPFILLLILHTSFPASDGFVLLNTWNGNSALFSNVQRLNSKLWRETSESLTMKGNVLMKNHKNSCVNNIHLDYMFVIVLG